MIDRIEFANYLDDQKADTLGAGLGFKYLDNLINLIPKEDFSNLSILDIGCGPFTTYDWFLSKYNCHIRGLDIGNSVQEISKTFAESKRKNLFCPADAHVLLDYFKPNSLDLILSFHSLEHMFDLDLVLSNIYTVLKNSGYLYFSLPCPSYNWKKGHWQDIPSIDFMKEKLKSIGFSIINFELITDCRYRPEQKMIGFVTKDTNE